MQFEIAGLKPIPPPASKVDFTKVALPVAGGMWNPRPGYKLGSALEKKKTYKTLPLAAKACLGHPKCSGIMYTKKTKTYTIHGSDQVSSGKGM